ncbi:MAG: FecR domain-containing protein [Myxococcales bacterium]|nr:FecR domain-containing protein [Myxococcales bacterium]
MSDRPLFAKLATDALAKAAPAETRGPTELERARAIAVAAAAIAQARRVRDARRRRLVGGGVVFAVAAAAASIFLVRTRTAPSAPVVATSVRARAVAGEPTVWRMGMSEPLHGDVTLQAGDRVRAMAGGAAQLQMSTGSQVALEEGGDLTLVGVQSADVLALSAGAARFQVAKVSTGRRFLVRTGDTEIEVRGTAFRVSVVPLDPSCDVASPTRVEVTEGRVVVRFHGAETVLNAGGKWPAGCSVIAAAPVAKGATFAGSPGSEPLPSPPLPPSEPAFHPKSPLQPKSSLLAPTPSSPAPTTTAAPAATVDTSPTAPTTAVAKKSSDLGAQNDLFTLGIDKKKAGDLGGARAAFDRYLALYPDGALVESATVEKMRLSSGAAQKSVAGSYLARWPKGFARAEAQAILDK